MGVALGDLLERKRAGKFKRFAGQSVGIRITRTPADEGGHADQSVWVGWV